MFIFFFSTQNSLLFLFIFFFLFNLFPTLCLSTSRFLPQINTLKPSITNWQKYNIESFIKAQRGSHVNGISELKTYLHRFGYLLSENANFTDAFDASFESAILRFQSNLGLLPSGKLDFDTISQISAPRCGVRDTSSTVTLHGGTRHYVYFPGKPRWTRRMPMKLTYAFSPDYTIRYLSRSEIRAVFKRAFARWASVIPVSFALTEDYIYADIKIGFYSGEHGDSEPFDGVLGVLAHSFSPENGKFHLDAAERWAVDFGMEKSEVAMDLESVATHEIGHLLGLAHSSVKEAVMYPTLKPREKKVDLQIDDIQGVQALYGSNPNFNVGSLSESDLSTNQAMNFPRKSTRSSFLALASFWLLLILIHFFSCMYLFI